MRLVAVTLAIAVAVGLLSGGRLSALSELRVRYAPLALVGLLLQLVNPPGRWPFVLLIASFGLLIIFAVANVRTPGFALVLVGTALNLTVIAVNAGMPVARSALVASGQADTLTALVEHRGTKHHLASSEDGVLFLGDVIPVPPPVRQVISVGDLFTAAGIGTIVVAAMRRRTRPVPVPRTSEASGVAV